MFYENIENLKKDGYEGFVSIEDLWQDSSMIPKKKGVYLILNKKQNNTSFINPGVGGFFKNKDPNVSIDVLKENFVNNSLVIYIGKAGGANNHSTLQSRLKNYLKFGQGKKAPHRGGRYIWQIEHHKNLIVCWKILEEQEPRNIEESLISEYESIFGRLPFANLQH